MSFYKTGTISIPNINESLYNTYDRQVYSESDNSAWIRIFHHNNPAENLFANTDTFTTSVYKNSNLWFNVSLCNLTTVWELMIIQARLSTDTPEKFRWIQLANPMVANYSDVTLANITRVTTSGYTTPDGNYAGIYKKNTSSYLVCNNGNSGHWFGAIGSWSAWNSGIPGYNGGAITSGYTDLYLRIDNIKLDKASIYNEAITSNNFIER